MATFEVLSVLAHRVRAGTLEFRTKWATREVTWNRAADMRHNLAVLAYLERHPALKAAVKALWDAKTKSTNVSTAIERRAHARGAQGGACGVYYTYHWNGRTFRSKLRARAAIAKAAEAKPSFVTPAPLTRARMWTPPASPARSRRAAAATAAAPAAITTPPRSPQRYPAAAKLEDATKQRVNTWFAATRRAGTHSFALDDPRTGSTWAAVRASDAAARMTCVERTMTEAGAKAASGGGRVWVAGEFDDWVDANHDLRFDGGAFLDFMGGFRTTATAVFNFIASNLPRGVAHEFPFAITCTTAHVGREQPANQKAVCEAAFQAFGYRVVRYERAARGAMATDMWVLAC